MARSVRLSLTGFAVQIFGESSQSSTDSLDQYRKKDCVANEAQCCHPINHYRIDQCLESMGMSIYDHKTWEHMGHLLIEFSRTSIGNIGNTFLL